MNCSSNEINLAFLAVTDGEVLLRDNCVVLIFALK